MNFQMKKRWKFHPQPIDEDTEDVINPARGWYEIYSFNIDEEINFEELKWSLKENQTLALVLVDFSSVANVDLDERHIKNLDKILDFFRINEKQLILRMTYDIHGKAKETEPASFSQILSHMLRLERVLKLNRKTVFTYQGFFIGDWGEMHDSVHISEGNLKILSHAFFATAGSENYFAVRTPQQWRTIFDENSNEDSTSQTGLFDDAIFGSDTHLGTFGDVDRKNAKWQDAWSREDELEFESNLCEKAPNGGEVVWGGKALSVEEVIGTLKKMKITYLNSAYDKRVLDKWKEQIIKSDDIWNGMSCYDYIGRHLGYRMVIENITLNSRPSNYIQLVVCFSNKGFAPIYDDVLLELIVVDDRQNFLQKILMPELDTKDIRLLSSKVLRDRLQPEKKYKVRFIFPVCRGKLYLRMSRKKDEQKIDFANIGREERGHYIGTLISR